MRPIPLLAAANGVGDPAAHPRGGAPNVGKRERERGELPPPTFPRGSQDPRGFVFLGGKFLEERFTPVLDAECQLAEKRRGAPHSRTLPRFNPNAVRYKRWGETPPTTLARGPPASRRDLFSGRSPHSLQLAPSKREDLFSGRSLHFSSLLEVGCRATARQAWGDRAPALRQAQGLEPAETARWEVWPHESSALGVRRSAPHSSGEFRNPTGRQRRGPDGHHRCRVRDTHDGHRASLSGGAASHPASSPALPRTHTYRRFMVVIRSTGRGC